MKKGKYPLILLLCMLGFCNPLKAASALRSDTINILHTTIRAVITDFTTQQISATTTLRIQSKINNIQTIYLDLEGLIIDSVIQNTNPLVFNQASQQFSVQLPTPLNIGDSTDIVISYHGVPIADATWGGFTFNGAYAYQMGVGFNAQPHSFGRTWHPCFDNFVERSSYEFYITTDTIAKAICNGILLDSSLLNGTITWHWKLDEEIPSYLASVAVNSFVKVSQTLNGINGSTTADVYCTAPQVNAVNGSFLHLQQSFSTYENRFGAYLWPKVGYTLVPFSAGAMEHATNIHIGNVFIDGTLNYETLIAHELSHHWWGDLVTCSTAQDMWLNEGFASYCEQLHTENVYGKLAYDVAVKKNQLDVLNRAHIYDEGYRAVANMDSNHTYGMTVYNKASNAIHTLRNYMGDSLFFGGLTAFLNTYKFKAINTNLLKDYLSTYSGINLNDYFNDWIWQPGQAHFGIDSFNAYFNNGIYYTSIQLRQRKHYNTNYYNHVPLELGVYDSLMQIHYYQLDFTGQCITYNIDLPFKPTMIIIDPKNKLSDATTSDNKIIKTTGVNVFTNAKCRLNIKSIINTTDSSFINIDHNWTLPDRFKSPSATNDFVLADSRYWTIQGIRLNNFTGNVQFPYDATSTGNFIDSSWLKNAEDSIRLFYRPNAAFEWTLANDSLVVGNTTDKKGNLYCREVKAGEYCIGIKRTGYTDPLQSDLPSNCNTVTSLKNIVSDIKKYSLFPNPTNQYLNIKNSSSNVHTILKINVTDITGKKISYPVQLQNNTLTIDTKNLPSGIYIVEISDQYGYENHKLIKE